MIDHSPYERRVKRVYILEFTPAQAVLWIVIALLLAAACFWLGSRLSPGRTPGPVPEAEEAVPGLPVLKEPVPEEFMSEFMDLDVDTPDVSLHPPYSRAHTDPVTAVALSPDGAYLATTSWDSTVKVWAVDTGKKVRHCRLDDMIWHALALSPGGRYAAFAEPFKMMQAFGMDMEISWVHVWDLEREMTVLELDKAYRAFAFSPDGRRFALLDATSLWLYDTGAWELAECFPVRGDDEPPLEYPALGFDAGSREITVLDAGRRVTLALEDGRRTVIRNDTPPGGLTHASALPRDPWYVAGVGDEGPTAWRFGPEQVVDLSPPDSIAPGPLVFTPDGRYLAVGNPEGRIDLLTVPEFQRIQHYTCEVDGLVALPDSKHLIAFDVYYVFLFSIEGAPLIRYFSDAINPEHYRIREGEEDTSNE